MVTELNKNQWIEILKNKNMTTDTDLSIFQAIYSFEGHKAYASQIGILLGYQGKVPHGPLNLEIGRYAKRIAKQFDIKFTERSKRKYKFWDLFFNGWSENNYFVWQLKPELLNAIEACHLTGEQIYAEELPTEEVEKLSEGIKKTIIINTYERNPKARMLCIEYWKSVCSVCKFDFESFYGEIGAGFIHVHHLVPVSKIGESYQIDPIHDLRPVCPNCHSMLHIKNPPLSIDELKNIVALCKECRAG